MNGVQQEVRVAVGTLILGMLNADSRGTPFSFGDWYVGITNDLQTRLYGEPDAGHNVPHDHPDVVTHECPSHDVADQVEGALHGCGCGGQRGLGHEDSRFVYAYKTISGVTTP